MLGIIGSDNREILPQKLFSASHSDFDDWANSLFSSLEIKRPRVVPTENIYEHTLNGDGGGDNEEKGLDAASLSGSLFSANKTIDASAELEELLRGGELESFSA